MAGFDNPPSTNLSFFWLELGPPPTFICLPDSWKTTKKKGNPKEPNTKQKRGANSGKAWPAALRRCRSLALRAAWCRSGLWGPASCGARLFDLRALCFMGPKRMGEKKTGYLFFQFAGPKRGKGKKNRAPQNKLRASNRCSNAAMVQTTVACTGCRLPFRGGRAPVVQTLHPTLVSPQALCPKVSSRLLCRKWRVTLG